VNVVGSGNFGTSPTVLKVVPPVSADQPTLAARVMVVPLRFYQRFVGPLIPPSCRFTPSCSEYAIQALRTHGALRGTLLAVRRLLRCAPWHPGGWDPVPPRRPARARTADTSAEEND
jgi:uncharacterized protein